jgi:hypothetical protein
MRSGSKTLPLVWASVQDGPFTDCRYRYRSSSNTPLAMNQSSPASAAQMMYPYGAYPQQRQQQQQPLHDMSRPSPPQSTWVVPQTHNGYYAMSNASVAGSREESVHLMASSNAATPRLPTFSSAAYSSDMNGTAPATSHEYFPSVIDTSMSLPQPPVRGPLTDQAPWGPKVYEELDSFHAFDPESSEFNRELMGQDENTPIIDLRQYPRLNQQEPDNTPNYNPHCARRMSESSFSISSTGGGVFPEGSTYEDVGNSEAVSYAPDCDAWNSLEPNTNHLMSPLASPRKPQYDNLARGGSRSRISPAPHNNNARASPYTLESNRFKRWSTGQAPTSTPASALAMMNVQDRFAPYGARPNPHHSMPAYPSGNMGHYALPSQNVLYSQNQPYHHGNAAIFAPQDQSYQLDVPRPLPSQGLFRLLQSNVDRHGGCSSHFADLSDPPDLYSSLHEEPSNPPESDMNPSDPDLIPHEQDLRFTGDLYTPRWVRGHGNKREGWCGLCKPGRWLVLKNSAFWYDKSFTHGVSAATGAAFQGPQDTRRTEGNLDVWEGLCGSCGEWIALVSSKKKGTTWFRHAYKVRALISSIPLLAMLVLQRHV